MREVTWRAGDLGPGAEVDGELRQDWGRVCRSDPDFPRAVGEAPFKGEGSERVGFPLTPSKEVGALERAWWVRKSLIGGRWAAKLPEGTCALILMKDRQAGSGVSHVITTGRVPVGRALPASGRFLWAGAPLSERSGFPALVLRTAPGSGLRSEGQGCPTRLWSASPQVTGTPAIA